MSAAIELSDLTLGYEGRAALLHLNGAFAAGSLTAVVGPNGSGKSTLLKGLTGALKPMGGRIERGGFGVREIAYLPQSAEIDRTFPASVSDLVALGLWAQRGLFRAIGGAGRQAVDDALVAVGLKGFARRPLDTLSGGQMQRALFARVLLQDAQVILLDEPFAAIDEKTVSDLIGLVRRWHGEKRTVIAVLHDVEMVREVFPQTLLLARESIGWGPTDDVLKPDNIARTRLLTETWDRHTHQHGEAA